MYIYQAINASLHIIAIILLSGALCAEFFLFRKGMTTKDVNTLLIADWVHRFALALILVTGIIYLHSKTEQMQVALFNSPFFVAKLVLFTLLVGLSLYPTLTFRRWRQSVRKQSPSLINYYQIQWVSNCIRLELTALLIIPVLLEFAKASIQA